MKCSLCKKKIDYELSFKDIFEFNFLCKDCIKSVKPKLTVIPIDDGYVINYYYFQLKDEYIDNIDLKINKEINELIKKEYKKSIILFLNDNILMNIKNLNLHRNITLISTTYMVLYDFID